MRIFSFLVLLFVTVSLHAQKKSLDMDHENFFRFGGKAGVNINKVNGVSFSKSFSYNFQLGGFVQFNFSNRFGIQPEINFVQSSAEISSDGTVIYDDLLGGGSQKKVSMNALEIPLLLNINLGPSKRVKLQLGPAYSGLLSQKIDSLVQGIRIYKKSEWSALGGIWFQLPLFNLGFRFKQGLSDINGIDNRQTWKNQAFQVFAGLTF